MKWGKERSAKPKGILLPSTICWPTHADICEILIKEPLEPEVTICFTLFKSFKLISAERPAVSRAWFNTRETLCSKDSLNVIPGSGSNLLCWASRIISCTFCLASWIVFVMSFMVLASAIVSPIPILNPLCSNQKLTTFWIELNNWAQTWGPFSLITVWIKPPPVAPTVFLSTTPNMISPSTINIPVSFGLNKSLPPSNLWMWIPFGIAIDNICFPDHKGFGLIIAGGGITPSQLGIQ